MIAITRTRRMRNEDDDISRQVATPRPLKLEAMKKTSVLLLAITLFFAPAIRIVAAEPVDSRLRQGLFQEEANHDLDAAIVAYRSVVQAHGYERKLAAT